MSLTQLLGVNAFACVAAFVVLWLLSIPKRDPSFVDSWWAFGIVMLAWLSFALSPVRGPHAWALAGVATLWGARLGGYLFLRWRKHGADRRYDKLIAEAKRERGWDYPAASLLLVFALQAPLQFVVALPVQLGMIEARAALGPLAWAGVVLALMGIAIEAAADAQLSSFKADPANAGKVMDRGLWRYSRHPNHFGDACVWWGLYLIAAETGLGAWSVAGPLLLTFLLLRVSGAPTIEGHMMTTRPDYATYVRNTSAFLPLPPRKS